MKDITQMIVDGIAEKAYGQYKREWCKERGYSFSAVARAEKKGAKYKGTMYVCCYEFAENNLLNEELAKNYLSEEEQGVFKAAYNLGRKIEVEEYLPEIFKSPSTLVPYDRDLPLVHVTDEDTDYDVYLFVGRDGENFYITLEDRDTAEDRYPEKKGKRSLFNLFKKCFMEIASYTEI